MYKRGTFTTSFTNLMALRILTDRAIAIRIILIEHVKKFTWVYFSSPTLEGEDNEEISSNWKRDGRSSNN